MASHLESVLPRGHVHAGDVDQIGELGVRVIPEESQDRDHSGGGDKELEFIAGGQLDLK